MEYPKNVYLELEKLDSPSNFSASFMMIMMEVDRWIREAENFSMIEKKLKGWEMEVM